MIGSLSEIVAPLAVEDFLDAGRRRALALRRGASANAVTGLLSWEGFAELVTRASFPVERFKVTAGRTKIPDIFYLGDGRIDAAKLAALFRHGVSAIAEPIDPHLPVLAAICAEAQALTGDRVKVAAVATTGAAGALARHYDPEDLLILQMDGAKRWRIHGPPARRPEILYLEAPEEDLPQEPPLFDGVLGAGEYLMVPKGYWHECHGAAERSLHLSLAFGWTPPR